MSHHIVEVKDLEYLYSDGSQALKGVSFYISHGESVALVGANGAGKSTLLMHLNGYFTPTAGKVRIGCDVVSKDTLISVRRSVGMVFQDPDDQLFMPTVGEDVAFGPLNLGFSASEVETMVDQALATVGASSLKDRPPYKLSSGEKRAVAIASVLAISPDILVMDEPSANLDPLARRRLIELLRSFAHTKIIATHDLDMALEICDRTIVIMDGKIQADGPTLDIFQDDDLLRSSHLERPLRLQDCPVCGKHKDIKGKRSMSSTLHTL